MTDLSIINWELATKLAGNKREIATELLTILVKNLPNDLEVILAAYQKEDWSELKQHVHKLHGATCYCGVPRLKRTLTQHETNLKTNIMDSLPSLIDELETEATLLLKYCESQSILE